uniref:Uncharacterized protein n=1 Tax=Sus scrofa TaxID=9823 RepID=A0A8D2BI08_PIG
NTQKDVQHYSQQQLFYICGEWRRTTEVISREKIEGRHCYFTPIFKTRKGRLICFSGR